MKYCCLSHSRPRMLQDSRGARQLPLLCQTLLPIASRVDVYSFWPHDSHLPAAPAAAPTTLNHHPFGDATPRLPPEPPSSHLSSCPHDLQPLRASSRSRLPLPINMLMTSQCTSKKKKEQTTSKYKKQRGRGRRWHAAPAHQLRCPASP